MKNSADEKILAFVAFCVEEYKTRMGCSGQKVMAYFDKFKVPEYLIEHYEVLHSMGREAIIADIDEFIRNRSKQI